MQVKQNIRTTLLHGPYEPPRTRPGKYIVCELRGKVKVGEFSDAPIPWPMKAGTRSIILCGALIDAVKAESSTAIMRNWGVSSHTVQKWRRALGVETYNEGTRWLQHMSAVENSPIRKMRWLSSLARKVTRVPKFRKFKRLMGLKVRLQIARTGRPVNPRLKLWTPAEDALLGTKSDEQLARQFGRTVNAVRARRHTLKIELPNRQSRPWTKEEERILGTVPDSVAAKILGRRERGVQLHRQTLGKRCFGNPSLKRPWTAKEDRLLGRLPDAEVARKLGRPLASVQNRRHLKGIPNPAPVRRQWTEAEDKLLGTMPDEEVARKVDRPVRLVARRRSEKGIANPAPTRKFWTPEEMKLLGTDSDRNIARKLGCSLRTVKVKRHRLGIPAPEAY